MKHLHFWQTALLIALCACSQNDYNGQNQSEADLKRENEYAHAWLRRFGPPAADNDWCLLRAVSADIRTASMGEGVTTRIYNDAPSNGGHVIAVAEADGTVRFDLKKETSRVYAEVSDASGNMLAAGMYDVDGESVRIDGSSNSGEQPESRYAHDASNGRSWFDAMITCEDLGDAANSDFDFNDIVFGLQHVAGTKALTITPMAAGGSLPAHISITIGDETHEIGESHALVCPGSSTRTMLNTYNPFVSGGKSVTVELPSADWTIADAWRDKKISIRVQGKGEAYELTPASEGNAPKMICLGGDWYWPVEYKAIDAAYSGFKSWAKGESELTAWVDGYNSLDDVVAWQYSQVADNWFSGESTGASYVAKLNNSRNVDVNSGERYYMYPATSTANMFSGRTDLTSIDITGDHFNTASVTSTSSMFNGCTNLANIDLSEWKTTNLTQVDYMFKDCSSLETLTLDGWDLSKLNSSYCAYVMQGCSSLKTLNISNAKFTNLLGHNNWVNYMGVLTFVKPTLTTINADRCTVVGTSLYRIFSDFEALTTLNTNRWDASCVTDMSEMFSGSDKLTTIDMDNWNVSSVTAMEGMFNGCNQLEELKMKGWQTDALTSTNNMFNGCSSLLTLDLSGWKTANLTRIEKMFKDCSSLETLTLDGWDLSKLNSSYCDYVMQGCSNLKVLNINNAHITNILGHNNNTNFKGVLTFVKPTLTTINADNCTVVGTSLEGMFNGFKSLTSLKINRWITSGVTNMYAMFSGTNQLKTINMDNWDVSSVTTMEGMFSGCTQLEELSLKGWEANALTNTNNMFNGCSSLLTLDLSGWKTANLTRIEKMFKDCSSLETLTLDGWDLSKLNSSYCDYVMKGCSNLKVLNINNAHITNMLGYDNNTNYMGVLTYVKPTLTTINADNCTVAGSTLYCAFSGCTVLKTANLNGWNVSGVTDFTYMFNRCEALRSLDLTGWVIPDGANMAKMFNGCNSALTITCSATTKAKILADNPSLVVNWDIR